jgi:hypothetical protein
MAISPWSTVRTAAHVGILFPAEGAKNLCHMMVLRENDDFYNTHRPHRALKQAAVPVQPRRGVAVTSSMRTVCKWSR